MGLCVDEFSRNFIEFGTKRNHDWNQLEDVVLYTTYETFMFHNFAFYFRMFKNIIDNLIPTGIMSHLIETHYTRKWKFEKFEDGPKVLSLDDLVFGFNIWLGCCLTTFVVFIVEQIRRIKSKMFCIIKDSMEKVTFPKINPSKAYQTESCSSLNTDNVKNFRIKMQKQEL